MQAAAGQAKRYFDFVRLMGQAACQIQDFEVINYNNFWMTLKHAS